MSNRHSWSKTEPVKSCLKCGASKRGKGDKLQFILPYRTLSDGVTPAGWTPEASFTPPCTFDAPDGGRRAR